MRYAHQRAPRKLSVPPTTLSRRYAPAASVQSSYLTLSGCQPFSQGGPRVRQARHRRRQQTLRRQSSCAHHVPHYTVQALRARGKRAVSRLTSRFRVASYCRRVDLECDKHGIGGDSKHCDDNAAQPDASAAATSTANTMMHNPTAFHTAGVTATCATLARLSTRTTKAKRSCSRLSPPLPSLSLFATY